MDGVEDVTSGLHFARSIYAKEAIDAAIEAFGALGRFELREEHDSYQVEIHDPDSDVADRLADEFSNYVLHETIIRTRDGA